ncbi:MAG: CvpA family protein [Chloroflexi bacterium]|nr:CvpA family protein [Chloroflexota bacterium]
MDGSALFLGLNVLDVVIVVVAAGIGFWGWRMGILRASVALLAIVVGVVVAGLYHERVFVDLAIAETPSGTMKAASFSLILTLVSVGGYILGTFLRGVATVLLLGWADRAAGGLFGVLFGLLLMQATFAMLVYAGLGHVDGVVGQSAIGMAMLDNAPVVRALLPSEFDLAIQSFAGDVDALRSSVDQVGGPVGGG